MEESAMSLTVIGHMNPDTDSIISAIAVADLLSKRGMAAQPAAQGKPTPETEFVLKKFGLSAPAVMGDVAGKKLWLVDYSDIAQAPKGLDSAEILGIVDHHKLGDVTTPNPLEIWTWPVGCTGTVIKAMYDFHGMEIPRGIAGGLLCAVLSDTRIFKSPSCTDADRQAAGTLAEIAGVTDAAALGAEMLASRECLSLS